ncbi:MAG: lipase family protein [Selenomonadaceae bacterium]|nr:lipase family protein [Selenomonadaceae bacterium]
MIIRIIHFLLALVATSMMIFVFTLTTFVSPRNASAAGLPEAEKQLVCALSSMASYEDDNGILVRDMLKDYGWDLKVVIDETKKANAKALIVSKTLDDGSLVKILAICGTNEIKDAEVDFRLKQVPANLKDNGDDGNKTNGEVAEDDQILVHQGFKDYSDVILNNNLGMNLFRELASKPNERLYLTGHSLGGAVAILTAAKLINLGAPADRMEVITFGAPAVGNKGFVNEYKDKIKLTRVTMSGDPVKKSLQLLGYVHFGEVKKYDQHHKIVKHFPHKMAVYLDCAIRDYYDERFELNPQGITTQPQSSNSESVYIAPIQIMKNSFNDDDFTYVMATMRDQMRRHFPTAVYDETEYREVEEVDDLGDFDNSVKDIQAKAVKSKCKSIIVYYLQAKKIRDDKDSNYRISIEEIKYNTEGFPMAMQTASVTTRELTTIEAAIFTMENLYRKGD